ncbi:crtp2 [Symbiodinium sp. CCMP2592]|nr:crtp2 [Symbiodinium sp. CCMP2592]
MSSAARTAQDSGAQSLETQLQRPLREVDSQKWLAPLLTQYGFAVGVVLTGCGNNIVKQIATRPLTHYTYILSLADAVAYLPVYGAILLTFLASGIVPGNQITFMWCRPGQRFPYFLLMVAAGFASAAADVVGMICTPYVTGPLHSLLSNCTSVYVALLSILLLRQRYSLLQVAALLFVLAAVIIGILPSFAKQDPTVSNQTNPFFALLLALSCIGNALSFILKEFLFKRYDGWLMEEYGQTSEKGLNIFVLNTHEAIAQLPFTLILVPLNVAFGQTNGQSLVEYLKEATDCVFQSTPDVCGSESSHAEWAGKLTLMYVVFNLCMNVTTLMAVKYGSALGTFVALKAIFPVSMVLFAYVQWPLLGKTDIHWLTWMSVLVLLPSIGVYQWATIQQNKRAAIHPSLASCCWPFGATRGWQS